jgi:hypothetical protein
MPDNGLEPDTQRGVFSFGTGARTVSQATGNGIIFLIFVLTSVIVNLVK